MFSSISCFLRRLLDFVKCKLVVIDDVKNASHRVKLMTCRPESER